jgi:hypothetical protein
MLASLVDVTVTNQSHLISSFLCFFCGFLETKQCVIQQADKELSVTCMGNINEKAVNSASQDWWGKGKKQQREKGDMKLNRSGEKMVK